MNSSSSVHVNGEPHTRAQNVSTAEMPLVSVLMITYNHGGFLAEAIESVLSQQCEFAFELIIGEDASSDETLDIALHYQQLFPEVVRVIHSSTNVGMYANWRRILAAARGEFLSYCEGDDYWCNPYKLARQVELIRDPRIGVVHSDWVRSKRGPGGWEVSGKSVHRRVPMKLLEGELFSTFHYPKVLRTCTVLTRRSIVEEFAAEKIAKPEYKFGDAVYAMYVTSAWRVAYLPEITAVYRHSPNSVLRSGIRSRIDFLKSSLQFDTDARSRFARRGRYPHAYRWEVSVGLLLWSVAIGDGAMVAFAIRDIRAHFGLHRFISAGFQTLMLRRPTLLPHRRVPLAAMHASGPGRGWAEERKCRE